MKYPDGLPAQHSRHSARTRREWSARRSIGINDRRLLEIIMVSSLRWVKIAYPVVLAIVVALLLRPGVSQAQRLPISMLLPREPGPMMAAQSVQQAQMMLLGAGIGGGMGMGGMGMGGMSMMGMGGMSMMGMGMGGMSMMGMGSMSMMGGMMMGGMSMMGGMGMRGMGMGGMGGMSMWGGMGMGMGMGMGSMMGFSGKGMGGFNGGKAL
jgi:hypothetical protein